MDKNTLKKMLIIDLLRMMESMKKCNEPEENINAVKGELIRRAAMKFEVEE